MLQLSFADSHRAPVWLVEASYSIGSDETCEIFLDHPSIMAHHAKLVVEGDRLTLLPENDRCEARVDGELITQATKIAHGNELQLGDLRFHIIDPKLSRKQPLNAEQQQKLEGWYLKAKTTALANKVFEVKGPVTLGRAKECDICLGVSHLSRKHALLMPSDGGLLVEDLGSSNGTYVAGSKIDGKKLARLGDEVRFDTLSFEVCRDTDDGEQPANDAGDVTSLRPAINADYGKQSSEPASSSSEAKPKAKRRSPRAAQKQSIKPASAGPSQKSESGGVQIIIGITLVSLLMLGLVFYLLS